MDTQNERSRSIGTCILRPKKVGSSDHCEQISGDGFGQPSRSGWRVRMLSPCRRLMPATCVSTLPSIRDRGNANRRGPIGHFCQYLTIPDNT
jgi:hypothetical protein